jgi:hypothetical protein
VNIKSDVITPGKPGPRSRVYNEGVDAAKTYRDKANKEAGNVPEGDSYSIQFLRDPARAPDKAAGALTKTRMLDILFGNNSPVQRVKFGEGPWITREAHLSAGGTQ